MNNPKISLIVAMSENRVIGKDNKLPWHIPEDLRRFKSVTSGHPVIMGRKTYDSIGRPLPGRLNIVITRDHTYRNDAVSVVYSLDDAIKLASQSDEQEIFIIGGGQIFEQAITLAHKLYLTVVHTEIEGDTYFPDFSVFSKKVFEQKGNTDEYSYTFFELEKE